MVEEIPQQNPIDKHVTLASIQTWLGATVATLLGLGVILVYSASAIRAHQYGWSFFYLEKQCIWFLIGLGGLVITRFIPLAWWRRAAPLLFLFGLVLLLAVWMPGVGRQVNGAARWIRIGGYNAQPSEFAKIALILGLASFLSRFSTPPLPFFKGLLPATLLGGGAVGLIAMEPDLGTAALLGVVFSALLLVGGARLGHMMILALIALPPAGYYVFTHFDHVHRRIEAWLQGTSEGSGYQIMMSKLALGSGGIWGMGLGQGTAKLYYLPEAHTDFIFAVAGQELGLVGALGIVLLFGIFVIQGIRLILCLEDRFSQFLAFGITFLYGLQAAFNIAVVTASIPPKGISLPWVSFGGSGLCVALASVGFLLQLATPPSQEKISLSEEEEEETELAEAA